MFEYEQETYGSKGPYGKEREGLSSSDAPPEG